jgi:Tfp pilus assembly protein PilF
MQQRLFTDYSRVVRFGSIVLFLITLVLFDAMPLRLVQAAPYIPDHDAVVLETLPLSGDSRTVQLRQWRQQLSHDPENLSLAIRLANQYLMLGHTEADPRFDGYARATLLPWWDQPTPPSEVLLIRATLRQRGHEFDAALQDLKQALYRQPSHPQAWLSQAVIHQVRGRYAEARQSCLPLLRLANSLVSTSCVVNISSVNGQAQDSYEALRQSYERNLSATTEEQLWALTILAETAARLGNHVQAENHFQQALVLEQKDTYLLGAYSDFLLDHNRATDVMALLQENIRPDGLLLRFCLAAQQLQSPQLNKYFEMLRVRFADSRLRGDARHLREEARFTLRLVEEPHKALQMAQENWKVQREPWDARIFLEAALLADNAEAAQPVLNWLKAVKLEDEQIRRLMEQFS